MTAVSPRPTTTMPTQHRPAPVRRAVKGSLVGRVLRTTDAKLIGIMYMVTAMVWFAVGGFLALLMRADSVVANPARKGVV